MQHSTLFESTDFATIGQKLFPANSRRKSVKVVAIVSKITSTSKSNKEPKPNWSFFTTLTLPMGICTPSNTRFLVPTRVHNPNGISIGSAVFVGLTTVTDRPTDHAILGL